MSSNPDPSTITMSGIDLNTTIGALLLGGLVSAVLYGITSTQTVVFYQRGQKDRFLVKLVVFVLWLLDSFDMCLICHILYWYLVSNYGNPVSLAAPIWSIILHVLVTSLTQMIVRGMFAFRVWKLSNGNWFSTAFVSIVSILNLACGIIITAKAFHTTFTGLHKLDALVYVEFVSGFSGDSLVALCLCYFLHKARTGIGRTENIINVLMAYVVNTGLLTAIVSSGSLILFASQPNNYIYVAVYLQLSKLYVNAYLAMLNARSGLREHAQDLVSIHLSRLSTSRGVGSSLPSPTSGPSRDAFGKDHLGIVVETTTDTTRDSVDYGDRSRYYGTHTV